MWKKEIQHRKWERKCERKKALIITLVTSSICKWNYKSLLQISMDCFQMNSKMHQNQPNCIRTNPTNTDAKRIVLWDRPKRHEGLKQATSALQKQLVCFGQQNYKNSTHSTDESFFLSLISSDQISVDENWMLLDPPEQLLACLLDGTHYELKSVSLFHFDYVAQEMKYKRCFLADQCFTFLLSKGKIHPGCFSGNVCSFPHCRGKLLLLLLLLLFYYYYR